MKKIYLFLLIPIILFNLFFELKANAQFKFTSENNTYSFDLPTGWEQIPSDIIKKYIDELNKRLPEGTTVSYNSGFQLEKNEYFDYPYILIQEFDSGQASYKQIEDAIKKGGFEEGFKKAQSKISELIKDSSINTPIYDKERNIIFITMSIETQTGDKVKGLSAMFIGKNKIVQLNFYAYAEDFNSTLPIFEKIIDTFEFKEGHKYVEPSASNSTYSRRNSNPVVTAISIAIFSAVAYGASAIYKKIFKKKEQ